MCLDAVNFDFGDIQDSQDKDVVEIGEMHTTNILRILLGSPPSLVVRHLLILHRTYLINASRSPSSPVQIQLGTIAGIDDLHMPIRQYKKDHMNPAALLLTSTSHQFISSLGFENGLRCLKALQCSYTVRVGG